VKSAYNQTNHDAQKAAMGEALLKYDGERY
jgi:hypothetical protein